MATQAAVCQHSGVTKPECSCKACVDELIQKHAPIQMQPQDGGK